MKLNGCCWLFGKFSGSGELFCSWSFFNFFFQNVQHKIFFQSIQLVLFHIWGVGPKNDPKVKKVCLETKKTTLKLESREVVISYDRDSCTKSQITLRDFQKSVANLTSDLLTFDFRAHFFPKKHQIPQKVIVFFKILKFEIKLKIGSRKGSDF